MTASRSTACSTRAPARSAAAPRTTRMIMIYPHNPDWDDIADIDRRSILERRATCAATSSAWRTATTGRSGAGAQADRLEPDPPRLRGLAVDREGAAASRRSRTTDWSRSSRSRALDGLQGAAQSAGSASRGPCQAKLDPNDWRIDEEERRRHPLRAAVHRTGMRRNGTREFVLDVARRHPDRLTIELDALVTKVLFDDLNRAVGVAYLQGRAALPRLAQPGHGRRRRPRRRMPRARSSCAGGAFNTPQLLMLSGIGPQRGARGARHQGARRPARRRPATCRTATRSASSTGSSRTGRCSRAPTFTRGDPQFKQWSRGAGASTPPTARRSPSSSARPSIARCPTFSCSRCSASSSGYFPGYSKLIAERPQCT